MLKIGVLASTKATDLQAVIDAIEKKELDAEIGIVVSNKKDAYALTRAQNHSIKSAFVDPKEFKDIEDKEKRRIAFDKKIAEVLDKESVDLILLIGYMRIVSGWFVEKYKNKIVNIHPSLLPAFGGEIDMNIHEKVLASGASKTGCTLHFVDEKVDHGPIIMQQEVAIEDDETPESLKEKVQKAEGEVIVRALGLFSQGKITVDGEKVVIF